MPSTRSMELHAEQMLQPGTYPPKAAQDSKLRLGLGCTVLRKRCHQHCYRRRNCCASIRSRVESTNWNESKNWNNRDIYSKNLVRKLSLRQPYPTFNTKQSMCHGHW